MMRRHAPTFVMLSFALLAPAAHAGTFEFIDNLFTFREDQKERVAPRRTLPPVVVDVPYYDERDASGWSNYYTREDLVARDYTPGSASKVMRPAPEAADSEESYWRMMQDRMQQREAARSETRVYVGEPGTGPGMQLGGYGSAPGNLAGGTRIGNPVNDWRSGAADPGMGPRPGDFDYVAPAYENDRFAQEDLRGGQIVTGSPRVLPESKLAPRSAPRSALNTGGHGAPAEYEGDPRYVDFNSQGQVVKYKVQKGDTLSGIAGQPAIYENWKLWPLIYSANRGAIGKSPANIKVNQNLGIPRDYTDQQAREAEARAGKR
jgi:hypothetical protein